MKSINSLTDGVFLNSNINSSRTNTTQPQSFTPNHQCSTHKEKRFLQYTAQNSQKGRVTEEKHKKKKKRRDSPRGKDRRMPRGEVPTEEPYPQDPQSMSTNDHTQGHHRGHHRRKRPKKEREHQGTRRATHRSHNESPHPYSHLWAMRSTEWVTPGTQEESKHPDRQHTPLGEGCLRVIPSNSLVTSVSVVGVPFIGGLFLFL